MQTRVDTPVEHDHPADDGLPAPQLAQVQRHQIEQEAGQDQLARDRREDGDGEQAAVGDQRPPLLAAERGPARRPCPHGAVQHGVDEQPRDRGQPGGDQEGRLEADAVGEDPANGRSADGGCEHPAHEHRHALGAVARVGVVGDPGLGGDEDEPIADAREDPPSDEVVIALGQERAGVADGRGHDSREEHPPCPEAVGQPSAERDHEHPGEHEQGDRKPEQHLVRYDRIRRTVSGDEQRQERTRQFLGEHEQEQRDPDLHGVAGPQLRAAGEAVAVLDRLAGRLDAAHDVLVDLGVLDLAHVEVEVLVALAQTSQRTVHRGDQIADLVARPHREVVAEDAPRAVGQHRLDALQRPGDPHAHQEHQEFQRHDQGDHDDGNGFVQELG